MKEVWNDCPLCGAELVRKTTYKIGCISCVRYGIDFHKDNGEFVIAGEFANTNSFEVYRSVALQYEAEPFFSSLQERKKYGLDISDFPIINFYRLTDEKIKKLLAIL